MTTTIATAATKSASAQVSSPARGSPSLIKRVAALMSLIPESLIALLGRFSIAAIFWKSGQTKIEGLAIDLVGGQFQLGVPRLADSAVYLFREEYRLPLLTPEVAATMAAFAEHLFPLLLLLGLATRFSAVVLLLMTLTIQLLVYPGAYPTHGVWATVLLLLVARGAGKFSLDHWLARRFA